MFRYDTTGITEAGNFAPAPDGDYLFRIKKAEEKKTKAGDNSANVELSIHGGPYAGKKVWHQVAFIPKDRPGGGIAKHWLHAIGEPYEGMVDIDLNRWAGKLIKAAIITEEYSGKNGKTKKNVIKTVYLPDDTPMTEATTAPTEQKAGVGF